MGQHGREGFGPGEGFMARATEDQDDDVEGHGFSREGFGSHGREGIGPGAKEGFGSHGREGYGSGAKATEDEDDVEGHLMSPREGFTGSPREGFAPAPREGFMARASEDEEDDVEGHGFNISSRTRGE